MVNSWIDKFRLFEDKKVVVTYCGFFRVVGFVVALDWRNSHSVIIRDVAGRVSVVNFVCRIEIIGGKEVSSE